MRVGILGGTFDPPHAGHLGLAEAALEALELDEVLFVPAHRNPQKKYQRQASPRDRMEMVRRMVAGRPKLAVSDIEVARGGPSYAVETLDELHYVRPADYWFLIGADAVKQIESWKQPERLVKLCRLGVAVRPPESFEDVLSRLRPEFRERVDHIPMKPVEASSTEIRRRLGTGQPISHWLAQDVLQYIRQRGLYQDND
jgi:nicotinate-nucleotide adenylyltransferase